ncbi:MAG: hypothetical protein IPP94_07420 [Ignavibacteria bacterium]|nr:hypothetical protein [Ignavibacteria bacterium]
MSTRRLFHATLFGAVFLASCSSPKEEIRTVKPETGTVDVTPPAPPRVFQYEDRYFVRDASIDPSTKVDDPLQAIRVIQLKPGTHDVLVISVFAKEKEAGAEVASETWFGIELPSMAPGTYDLAKAAEVKFYRFHLGDKPLRLDGQKCTGTITIEDSRDGFLTGAIVARIEGVSKSFLDVSAPFTTAFTGSFRIKEVPLEATLIKGR